MAKSNAVKDDGQRTLSSFFQQPTASTSSARTSSSRKRPSSSSNEPDLIVIISSDEENVPDTPPSLPTHASKKVKSEQANELSSWFRTNSSLPTTSKSKPIAMSSSSSPSSSLKAVAPSGKVLKWKYMPSRPIDEEDVAGADMTMSNTNENDVASTQPSTSRINHQAPPKLLAIDLLRKKKAYLQDQDPMAAISRGDEGFYRARSHSAAESPNPEDAREDDEEEPLRKEKKKSNKGKGKAISDDEDGNEPEATAAASSRLQKYAAANNLATGASKSAAVIKYTPLEQQVIALRKAHPGVLLVIEVGYKFRFFEEDAVTASRILGIAHFPNKHMMSASIPTHRLDVHIKRLINAGQKVGVVRQKETAALKKASSETRQGPFVRALDALYTSATYIDPLAVSDSHEAASGSAATILCLVEEPVGKDEKVTIALVAVRPSTGEVIYDEFVDGLMRSELETRMLHLQPTEVVLPPNLSKQTESMVHYLVGQHDAGNSDSKCRVDRFQKRIEKSAARKVVTEFYLKSKKLRKGKERAIEEIVIDSDTEDDEAQVKNSENTGLSSSVLDLPQLVLVALAALILHLSAFDLSAVFVNEVSFEHFSNRTTMNLNGNTLQNLELLQNSTDQTSNGSLLSILDHTKSAFGRRRLRNWICNPLIEIAAVEERLDAVAEIINSASNLTIFKLRDLFKGLPDLGRGLVRIHFGRATPQELLRVLQAFSRVANVFQAVEEEDAEAGAPNPQATIKSSLLRRIVASLPKIKHDVDTFLARIDAANARDGKKAELFRNPPQALQDGRDCLEAVDTEMAHLLKDVRQLLKKPKLEFRQVAEEEFLLEISNEQAKEIVPSNWIKINSTKQYGRYRSPAIQAKMDEVNQNRERLDAVARAAFKDFLQEISTSCYASFRSVITNLATADCLFSFAVTAIAPGYARPKISSTPGYIKIVEGRHPIHEVTSALPYVPSSVELGAEASPRVNIISGVNAGGKSSFVRSVALIALMAQIGCYVPAESCTTSLFDGIFTRMGAMDEIARQRSTFMVELSETSEILKLATGRSLVILDELGRGTSTNDGQAIASAVLQYIATTLHARTLFITHYPSLAVLAKRYPESISVHHMRCLEQQRPDGFTDVTFLYKVGPGLAPRSHGLNVARLAELPESVLKKALEKSKELEQISETRMRARRSERMAAIVRMLVSTEVDKRKLMELCSNALL